VVDADVSDSVPVFAPAEPIETAVEEAPVAEAPAPREASAPAVVASLHLGDLGTPDIAPDSTMEFDVAEFGFGERDEDVDIEEID
jgi:hypothetical protein